MRLQVARTPETETPMSLQQALEQLCQPVRRRDYPRSLATMQALLRVLGEPQRSLTAITVTGSSGKSSVCYQLATLLQAQGLRCGCYLSPHMHSFRERFQLDGAIIGVEAFCAGATIVAEAAAGLPGPVSTFERATALALWWFRQQDAQVVVLETGLGGRYDAVNAAGNCLALFTGIEAEHTALLGGDLAGVAWHKAGIMQPGGQAISAIQQPVVRTILQDEAARVGTQLRLSDEPLVDAALANLVERGLARATPVTTVPKAAPLSGRLEAVTLPDGPPLLIDGGHTAAAAQLLRATIERRIAATPGSVQLVAGFLADKDAGTWLQVFDDPRYHITLTRAPGHRAAEPQLVLAQCRLQRTQCSLEPDLARALQAARATGAQLVVVSGSLRMAARARVLLGLLNAETLAEAQLTERVFRGADYLARLPD